MKTGFTAVEVGASVRVLARMLVAPVYVSEPPTVSALPVDFVSSPAPEILIAPWLTPSEVALAALRLTTVPAEAVMGAEKLAAVESIVI